MSLSEKLATRMSSLSAFTDGVCLCDASDGTRHVECELTALDTLACQLFRLGYSTNQIKHWTKDQLKSISESLSKQLTYLMEPISPIEVDAHQSVVQMRSKPPRASGQGREYFEITVMAAGSVRVERFAKQPGAARTQVPAFLTREALVRLVADLELVVG